MSHVRKTARILCPTDFSACSRGALEEAAGLAELTGAEICLLHVFQDPAYMLPLGGYAGPLADVLGEMRDRIARDLDAHAPFPQGGRTRAFGQRRGAGRTAGAVLGVGDESRSMRGKPWRYTLRR